MTEATSPANFLENIVAQDLETGRVSKVVTRFPPEPNGYLHLGHAKSISVNFDLAERFGGACNLRFDDTNPAKESQEYIESIQNDIKWLGYQWEGEVRFASSYFQQFYDWAVFLVEQGNVYVCDLSADEAREYRGTLTEAGRNSPYRERSVEENLALLAAMKAGEFEEGSKTLRAKIDMASPNMNLRDPILYRIRKVEHHQTGNDWCIYPTYDFAHGQEDAIEGVTHSICTLEFEDHKPLYEWYIEHLPIEQQPKQYEFGRFNTSYTVTSKRKLMQLVDDGVVAGWDDPRMPTVAGMRRRGYPPQSIRRFCNLIGTTRKDGVVDFAMLEHVIRDDLNESTSRAMCVINPIKLILTNYPQDQVEELSAPAHPNREEMGQRLLPFTRELVIDREDFREEANKKFKRLVLGKRVRLRNAYVIEADEAIKNEDGEVVAVHCRIIEGTVGNDPADGIKPKGVVHWVSASKGIPAEIRLYDRLFTEPEPGSGGVDFMEHVNRDSLKVLQGCLVEPGLVTAVAEQNIQFEREGYFVADRFDHSSDKLVFNKTIGLRDTWAKLENS